MTLASRAPLWVWLTPVIAAPLLAAPASAHHLMELFQLKPGPMAGLLSGLGHPLLGPDHLLFLLSLGLVGISQPRRWMLGLLAIGLAASGFGLLVPHLPGAEALVALSLVALGLVMLGHWPRWTLLPAIALHGYVLSDAVIGWEPTPVAAYLLGLLLSQAALLLLASTVVRGWSRRLGGGSPRLLAGILIGIGATFAWTALVP